MFASMLGVASAAPNYLGQQPSTPQPQQSQQPQPSPLAQSAPNYGQDYRVAQGNASFLGNQQGYQSFGGVNAGNNGTPNTPANAMPQGYNPAMPNSPNSANLGGGYGQSGWSGTMQQPGGQGMGAGMAPQIGGVPNAHVPNAMHNYGAASSSPQMANQSDDQRGKKRGLFGAFLDWLSR